MFKMSVEYHFTFCSSKKRITNSYIKCKGAYSLHPRKESYEIYSDHGIIDIAFFHCFDRKSLAYAKQHRRR